MRGSNVCHGFRIREYDRGKFAEFVVWWRADRAPDGPVQMTVISPTPFRRFSSVSGLVPVRKLTARMSTRPPNPSPAPDRVTPILGGLRYYGFPVVLPIS